MEVEPLDVSFWAELDEIDCPCKGWGWSTINGKTESCPIHFHGQLHPQSRELLLDEPERLQEEERKSHLQWKLSQAQDKIKELTAALKQEQSNVVLFQLELINRTPTTKLQTVKLPPEAMGGSH